MTADIARNNLDLETSPYLLQHRDNPVHWQAWGPAALAAAKAGNKPILLSVGYAACHWCHVMAHESFEKPAVAALMNELFVNIKVDREERPDIDTIYQTSLALLGEQGGWPLTMFLTPDGEPFWGGTYFPPEPRYGRPSFPDLLRRVADVFHQDRETIDKNRAALMNGLSEVAAVPTGAAPAITPALLDQIAARLLREVDRVQGGIGQAPKFPQSYLLELLWRGYLRSGNAALGDAVTLTLDRMSQGGIYDHLGGGYARYATDNAWLVPHFEKMLYDNALLLDLLCLVAAETGSRLYEARIRETIGWVLRDMQAEGGAFAASQDADSEGVEGKFYVWSEAEIDAHLGADAEVFKAAYDVSPAGNWEGHTILNRTARPALGTPPDEEELARLRHVLFDVREQRVKPGWDDKVLADWNGLMIAALAHAGAQFREPGWIAAAARAFDFIRTHMVIDGRLRHSYRHGQAKHSALLDDYASMARAALALFEATGEADYLAAAESWMATLDRHYWDNEHGGYFFTADDAEALISRSRSAADNATPSGNGTALGVLARLYYLTGTDRYRQRAAALLAGFAGALTRNFFPLGTLLNAAELLHDAVQIAIIGERDDPATQALIAACYSVSLPNRVLLVSPPGAALPAGHPAAEKPQKDKRPTAYVCIGTTCSLPLTGAEALRQALPHP